MDAKYKVRNSIRVELRSYNGNHYSLVPKSFGLKGEVTIPNKKRDSLLLGARKLLNVLNSDYLPDSVRVREG